MTKAMAVVLDEKSDLTDAQLYALFRAVEYHYTRIGENYAGQEKRPIRLWEASYGTVNALIRKGYVEVKEAKDDWGRKKNQNLLTKKAIRVGISEFERIRGKAPMRMAEGMQAATKKRLEKERKEVEKVSNLFKGMTITHAHGGRESLDRFIYDQLSRGSKPPKNTKVEFTYSQLKRIGDQVEEMITP